MNPHKLAALRLMGLTRADRLRVLRRLPRDSRAKVRKHLDGLARFESLALPFRHLLVRVLDGAERARFLRHPADPDSAAAVDDATLALDRIEAARVAPALEALPPPLQASLLRAHAWRWRRAYLNRHDRVARRRLLSYLHGARIMTDRARRALASALLEIVDARTAGGQG